MRFPFELLPAIKELASAASLNVGGARRRPRGGLWRAGRKPGCWPAWVGHGDGCCVDGFNCNILWRSSGLGNEFPSILADGREEQKQNGGRHGGAFEKIGCFGSDASRS